MRSWKNYQKVYDVIIIGAGIAGLGASLKLSQNGVDHIILQARNRIGGRIAKQIINGVSLDQGAAFVHVPQTNHQIWKLMQEKGWNSRLANQNSQQILQERTGVVSKQISSKCKQIYQGYVQSIKKNAQKTKLDISMEDAGMQFYKKNIQPLDKVEKNVVNLMISSQENFQGEDIKNLSAKKYYSQDLLHDVIPQAGYHSIVDRIYELNKTQVKFNEVVRKIDYLGDQIIIETRNKSFRAKKVISSLPLGILKQRQIQFEPHLPKSHVEAIEKLGYGIANKIFVSFEKPFWNIEAAWIKIACDRWGRHPFSYNYSVGDKYILCSIISGNFAKQLSKLTDEEMLQDYLKVLRETFKIEDIKVKDYAVVRWDSDEFALGCYSYFKVGSSQEDIKALRISIDNKIWFIGQHCNPQGIGCAHAAYETGLEAGEKVPQLLKYEK